MPSKVRRKSGGFIIGENLKALRLEDRFSQWFGYDDSNRRQMARHEAGARATLRSIQRYAEFFSFHLNRRVTVEELIAAPVEPADLMARVKRIGCQRIVRVDFNGPIAAIYYREKKTSRKDKTLVVRLPAGTSAAEVLLR